MALILLKADGATVVDLTNIPGSASARQAHLEGQIDAMWEYTGTGWITYLGHDKPIPDEQKQYEAVRDEDAATELPRLAAARPDEQHLRLRDHRAEREEVRHHQAVGDEEGPGQGAHVLRGVGVRQPSRRPQRHAQDVRRAARQARRRARRQHRALPDRGDLRRHREGQLHLRRGVHHRRPDPVAATSTVLEDDRQYFPNYNVSLVVRHTVLEDHPEIQELIEPVAEKLTNKVLLKLNAEIDVKGREPADVAAEWLTDEGFLQG